MQVKQEEIEKLTVKDLDRAILDLTKAKWILQNQHDGRVDYGHFGSSVLDALEALGGHK